MKENLLFAVAASVFLLASCAKDPIRTEDSQSNLRLRDITVQASLDTPSSRVSVSDGNLSPEWSSDDVIAVFDDAKRPFTIKECSGNTAVFEGSVNVDYEGTLYAAYPYGAVSSRNGESVSLVLPSTQIIADGSAIDEDALLAVALSADGSSFHFRNVCGLVRFELAADDIVSVTLAGNDAEALAGTVTVPFDSGEISGTGSSASVTLSTRTGDPFPAGVYFLAVAPVRLDKGLSVTLTNTAGQTAVKTSSHAAVIPRSSGINLGEITAGLTWQDDFSGGIIPSDDVDPEDEDIVSNTTFDYTVRVIFSDSGDAVVKNGSSLGVTVDGNGVTITNSTKKNIIYELSGSTSNGFFKLYSSKKQAIVLNNVRITNPNGAAINNQSKKRTFVVVKGTNSLADGAAYTATPADEDEKAAFFSEGQLVFSGSGSLSVTATGKTGIGSDDYIRFMSAPKVAVTSSAGHGVRGKDYILVSNGQLEAEVSADTKKGFSSDSLVVFEGGVTTIRVAGSSAYVLDEAGFKNAAGVKGDKGVRIKGGTLDVTCTGNGAKGIGSDVFVSVEGGSTTITMSGGVVYDKPDDDYKGTAGIKADNWFGMTAGSLTIVNSGRGGKGISAGDYDYDSEKHTVDDSFISGGTIQITTTGTEMQGVSCKAIKTGWVKKKGPPFFETVTQNAGDFLVSGGRIVLNCSGAECFEVKGDLTVNGGEIHAASTSDDAINAQGEIRIDGGYVYAFSSRNDAIDANHDLKLSGGCVMAVTTNGAPEMALDANSELGYRLYINEGATVVAYGGLEGGYSASQGVYSMQCTAGEWNALYDGSTCFAAFKAPSGVSSVAVSAPSLSRGYSGVSVSGTTYANGTWATSGISGGNAVSLGTYSGGGSGGGGHHW